MRSSESERIVTLSCRFPSLFLSSKCPEEDNARMISAVSAPSPSPRTKGTVIVVFSSASLLKWYPQLHNKNNTETHNGQMRHFTRRPLWDAYCASASRQ